MRKYGLEENIEKRIVCIRNWSSNDRIDVKFFLPRYFIYTFWNDSIILSLFFSALCINEDVEDEPEENDISSESEQQVEMFAQNEEGETKNGVEIEKKVDIAITNNVKNIQDDSMTGNEQQQLPSELNNVDHETSAKKETEVPITKRNNSMSITEEENLDPVVEEKEKNHDEWFRNCFYYYKNFVKSLILRN